VSKQVFQEEGNDVLTELMDTPCSESFLGTSCLLDENATIIPELDITVYLNAVMNGSIPLMFIENCFAYLLCIPFSSSQVFGEALYQSG
jgi:hypothetical protein